MSNIKTAPDRASQKFDFLVSEVSKPLLIVNILLASAYFLMLCFFLPKGTVFLYSALMLGEAFHVWQLLGYAYTIWNTNYMPKPNLKFNKDVDIFITVAGEPIEIVEETAIAARDMDYPNHHVYLLNDSFVAKKENWKEYEDLAKKLGIGCITRTIPGGAKAGNINNAMRETNSPFITIFDADHIPHKDFLKKMMGYFEDSKMAFVQSPQYYKNQKLNYITGASWEQQALFFGPILKGKNRLNSAFMCGTNMVLRREAIDQVGGMCETNIAEDFLTSLFVHQKGWNSIYVPEVLAEGLAPEDFLSYYKQQFRWTRGSLEVIFKYNPLFMKGLSFAQKIQYLSSASYYLSGAVILIDALLPLFFLYFGLVPLTTSTMAIAALFIPYMALSLYILQLSGNFNFTFRALSFSLSSFYIQIKSVIAVLTNQKTKFAVTSKQQIQGNFLYLVTPHFIYLSAVLIGIIIAILREGVNASVATNISWALLNVITFIPFIYAAAPDTGLKGIVKDLLKKIFKFNYKV